MSAQSIRPLSLYDVHTGNGTVTATGDQINLQRMPTVKGIAAVLNQIASPEEQVQITRTANLQTIWSENNTVPDARVYNVGEKPIMIIASRGRVGSITTWHIPKPLAPQA